MPSNQDASREASRAMAVIGGGAAGFFAAISAAEADPAATVTIYEKGTDCLAKVTLSGGGRCNVTNACFDPAELMAHYPRGGRELRGAFHRWQPADMMAWLEDRGVTLKVEDEGRVFPASDDAQSIVDCLLGAARAAGVEVCCGAAVSRLAAVDGGFDIELADGSTVRADTVCVAPGSLKGSPLVGSIQRLGHAVEPLVPSLFGFNVADHRTSGLAGLSVPNAAVRVLPDSPARSGAILITHRGLSGPAILRLSAWEARRLAEANHHIEIAVNWLGGTSADEVRQRLARLRETAGKGVISARPIEPIPRRLWQRLVEAAGIAPDTTWAQLRKDAATALVGELTEGRFRVQGRTSNRDEFVTCGGVRLKEVDFRTMESRLVPGLYFAGECLDIDGLTGGFNFQAAWTTGRLAGLAMVT